MFTLARVDEGLHSFWATVSIGPLCVCDSVTVYCGQTVGWIRMPLGIEVGLGQGMLEGDQAPLTERGTAAPPHFRSLRTQQAWVHIKRGPCLLWPNHRMDQDATWYKGRSRPRQHCVRCGPSSPNFLSHFALARSPISATAELLCGSVSDLYRRVIFPYRKFIASKL